MKKNEKKFNNNSGLSSRKIAVEILLEIIESLVPLDDVFNKFIKQGSSLSKMQPEDRSFCRLLVSSTLRNLTEIDYILNKFLKKSLDKSPPKVQMILRIGIVQIVYLQTPDHAATNTSVELGGNKWKSLINAIMRNVLRGRDKINAYQSESPKTPSWLSKRWKRDWGDNFIEIENAHRVLSPPIDLCVKKEAKIWADKLNGICLSDKTIRLNNTSLISELEGFNSGDWWVQDYSSQIPVTLLNIEKGEEVLDLCAAPGGKTAQLISMGANVTSVDGNKKRIARLEENLARLKFNSKIFHSDVRGYKPKETWSKIILDAPCSSTGTLRRHPDIMHIKSEGDVQSLVKLQSELLLSTWKFLANGGSLIYCTCSLEKEEGENQIFKFINENKDAKIDKIKSEEVIELKELITKEGLLRIFPNHLKEIGGMDGFFIARLKKVS